MNTGLKQPLSFLSGAGADWAFRNIYLYFIAGYRQPVIFLLFPEYIIYYVGGYYVRRYWLDHKHVVRPLVVLFILLTAFTAVATFQMISLFGLQNPISLYFFSYLSPNVPLMTVSIFIIFNRSNLLINLQKKLNPKWIKELSDATLGIYIVHPIFIVIFLKGFGYLNFHFSKNASWGEPALAMACFTISFIVVAVTKKIPSLKRIF